MMVSHRSKFAQHDFGAKLAQFEDDFHHDGLDEEIYMT